MVKLNLIKKGDKYEVDMSALRKIESAIKNLKGRQFNLSTKRWAIFQDEKDSFIESIKEFAEVEIKDDREDRTATIKIEKKEEKIIISIVSFPKISKSLDPLFSFFKTVPGRFYESITKRWIFSIKNEELLINGIKNIEDSNSLIINSL